MLQQMYELERFCQNNNFFSAIVVIVFASDYQALMNSSMCITRYSAMPYIPFAV